MRDRIDGLQSLRAVASMLVVIDHIITQLLYYKTYGEVYDKILGNIKILGDMGVYVFFILSGYIMLFSTQKKRGPYDAMIFLKKRFLRIYPVYWFWLSFLLVLWAIGLALKQHYFGIERIISSYLLLPYSPGNEEKINPILSQGWTLIYEMAFYVVFSLTIFFKRKENIAFFTVGFGFILINLVGYLFKEVSSSIYIFFFSWYFYLFLLGMVIYLIQDKIAIAINIPIIQLLLIVIIAVLLVDLLFLNNFNKTIEAIVLAFFLFLLFLIKNVTSKMLRALGDSSYSLYLSHGIIAMFYGMLVKKIIANDVFALMLVIPFTIASIIFGHIAYLTIEKKINNYTTSKKDAYK
ncbi:TPA: acyltransferase family protein [Klebsiella variicola]